MTSQVDPIIPEIPADATEGEEMEILVALADAAMADTEFFVGSMPLEELPEFKAIQGL